MKKIFLSGDPTHPLYHRYQNVAAALESVFEAYEIACVSEHFETFETQDYEKYDLAVLYTDHWIDKTGTSHQQVQALSLIHICGTCARRWPWCAMWARSCAFLRSGPATRS